MSKKQYLLSHSQGTSSQVVMAHPSEVADLSRRQLLKTGVSLTAYASVAGLLGKQALAASTPSGTQRKLIWINMSGGWDLLETTDPKVQSTANLDVIYGYDLASTVGDGVKIGRWLPQIGALGSDVLVVRGLAMGTTSHNAGSVYMDTGILSNAGRVNSASIPAIVASESTATIPVIQLSGGSEPQTDRGLLNPVSVVRAENLDLYRSMYPEPGDATERRLLVLDYLKNSLTRVQDEVGSSDRLLSLSAAEEKVRAQFAGGVGSKLALTDADRTLFAADAPRAVNAGGRDAMALALKLISNDIVSCITLGIGGFDTHQNQSTRLQPILANVDFLVSRLVAGLKAAGKLDSTLIVMYSDFGRTPKVNSSNGRDHWPVGGAIVIGGGIDGGRAVGATSDSTLGAADLINPTTGAVTSDSASGVQLNPTHLGGMVLELTLGASYSTYRPYLAGIPALTRLKGT